jgi:hypothetical protein
MAEKEPIALVKKLIQNLWKISDVIQPGVEFNAP